MIMRTNLYPGLIAGLTIVLAMACRHDKPVSEEEYLKTKESLVGANRILVKKDNEKIKAFLTRKNWNMQQTASGLWYMILKQGSGRQAKTGNVITLDYTLELLDGTLCYSSDSLGPKQFRIGQGGVESGLEEGVLLLHQGDMARLIIPPHLAHGLTGDNDRIPARAIVVYELEVVKIED